jgi:uncharacterized protein YecA (UPF0149 family)
VPGPHFEPEERSDGERKSRNEAQEVFVELQLAVENVFAQLDIIPTVMSVQKVGKRWPMNDGHDEGWQGKKQPMVLRWLTCIRGQQFALSVS